MKFNKKIDPKNIKFRVEEEKVLQLKEIIREYYLFQQLNICFMFFFLTSTSALCKILCYSFIQLFVLACYFICCTSF